jgi:hypothetical protein
MWRLSNAISWAACRRKMPSASWRLASSQDKSSTRHEQHWEGRPLEPPSLPLTACAILVRVGRSALSAQAESGRAAKFESLYTSDGEVP